MAITHRHRVARLEIEPHGTQAGRRCWPCVISTDTPVRRSSSTGDYLEILSHAPGAVDLSRAPLPVLEGHDQARVNIGVVDQLRLEGGKLRGMLCLGESQRARELAPDIEARIVRGLSVGYDITEPMKRQGEAEDGTPIYVAEAWAPHETSIVGVPADPNSGFFRSRGDTMSIVDPVNGPGGQQSAPPAASPAAAPAPAPSSARSRGQREDAPEDREDAPEEREMDCDELDPDADPELWEEYGCDDRADDGGEERARGGAPTGQRGQHGDCRCHGQRRGRRGRGQRRGASYVDTSRTIRSMVRSAGQPDDLAAYHIRERSTVHQVARVLESLARRPAVPPASGVSLHRDRDDKLDDGVLQWLAIKSGTAQRLIDAAVKRREQAPRFDAGEYNGMSLIDLGREYLSRAGMSTRGRTKMDVASDVLTLPTGRRWVRSMVRSGDGGGLMVTGAFPVALQNWMHKTLLAEYELAEAEWPKFCGTGSVNDFRPHYRYRMGTFGALDSLNEQQEFRRKYLADAERESVQADTKGNIIGISRKMLIDDDISAVADASQKLGREALYTIERDVIDLLTSNSLAGPDMGDGNPLLDNTHGNVTTSSAISVAELDEDAVAMAAQKDPSGNRILGLKPSILMVSRAQLGKAISVLGAQFVNPPPFAADDAQDAYLRSWVGSFFKTIIGHPLLSGNGRYVMASPASAKTLEVSFLDGQSTPYLEMREGWLVDGLEYKVRLDYAVGAVDWRGIVFNAGG